MPTPGKTRGCSMSASPGESDGDIGEGGGDGEMAPGSMVDVTPGNRIDGCGSTGDGVRMGGHGQAGGAKPAPGVIVNVDRMPVAGRDAGAVKAVAAGVCVLVRAESAPSFLSRLRRRSMASGGGNANIGTGTSRGGAVAGRAWTWLVEATALARAARLALRRALALEGISELPSCKSEREARISDGERAGRAGSVAAAAAWGRGKVTAVEV